MSYLQSVNKIKCSNTVIVMTGFMVMAYKVLIAWTNLLPPNNSEWKSVLESSSGLQNCFVSEGAGIDTAGGARLDGLPGLANMTVAVCCVFLTSVAAELR